MKKLLSFLIVLSITTTSFIFVPTVLADGYIPDVCQDQGGYVLDFGYAMDYWKAGQSFIPTVNRIDRITICAARLNELALPGGVKCGIYASYEDMVDDTNFLGESTIQYSSLNWPIPVEVSFTFSSQISLTSGNTYWFAITPPSEQGKGIRWLRTNTNVYSDGQLYRMATSGWQVMSSQDFYFKTFFYNHDPNTPSTPSGPSTGYTGTSYTYSTSATDPDGDQVYYKFDWGDGTNSGWVGSYNSGQTGSASKTWTSPGTYSVKAKAKDTHEDESGWSSVKTVTITNPNSPPNTPSTPSGPTSRTVGQSGTYSTSATDPDGDQVQYRFDWGDGTTSDWTNLVPSGTSASKSHSWGSAGMYVVMAQTRDEHGATSGWSNGLTVTVSGGGNPQNNYAVLIASDTRKSLGFFLSPVFAKLMYWRNVLYCHSTLVNDLGYDWRNDVQVLAPYGETPFSNPPPDGVPSKQNMQYLLETWLAGKSNENSNCLIYMIGPCNQGGIYGINDHESVTSSEIDNWLNGVEYNTLTVVIEGSYSGRFIEELSAENRIIITSTNENRPTYAGSLLNLIFGGCFPFTEAFFGKLAKGYSYGEAWEAADQSIYDFCNDWWHQIPSDKHQIPLIDDNGDGIGHGTDEVDKLPIGGDGNLALITYPGGNYLNDESASLSEHLQELANQQNSQSTLQNNNEQSSSTPTSSQNNQQSQSTQ